MIANKEKDFFKFGYFGRLMPNSEEYLLDYEKKLNIKPDNKISYKYNNLGFRCDDFTGYHDGLHILFAGCSETEGASNALNECWANVLYNKIKIYTKTSGYYNVGKTGLTISSSIFNIFQYINDYGIPDCIFLQLPDHGRYVSWSKENGIYPVYQNTKKFNSSLAHFFTTESDPKDIAINIFFNNLVLRTLIQFCRVNSIRLIWSSWNDIAGSIDTLSEEDMLTYITTSPSGKDHWNIKLEDLIARDGYHLGRGFHKIWAEKFYKEFTNDKNNKKNSD